MINVEQVITHKFPSFASQPSVLRKTALFALRRLFHEQEVNRFLTENHNYHGFEFIDRVLDYFNFTYSLSNKDQMNIPSSGRVLIIANHPLGALDGLALLKMIGEIRKDVRIVANDMLASFTQLSPLLLPVDNLNKATRKQDIANINKALHNEEAVIVFPAGEVSRAGPTGIKDNSWNQGFLHFAKRTNCPILPIFIGGKNSSLFYTASGLNKALAALLLPREMFNKRAMNLQFKVGEPIPYSQLDKLPLAAQEKSKMVRKHLYRLAKGRKPIFKTEKTIAHPQNRQALKKELKASELLGETADGKRIYLFDYHADSTVMREVGRLREVSFRCVGEGTGEKLDLDRYDSHYRHLILWDEEELEIVGAYRLAEAWKMNNSQDDQLYSSTLFNYSPAMQHYFEQGIELGRSFVQPKYWGKRSLDYLWYGIGAYLKRHPKVRYMFGPVSLSNRYPQHAKDLLVYFYSLYFPDKERLGRSLTPYTIKPEVSAHLQTLFSGNDYKEDFKTLKQQMDFLNCAVPTLYKQYADVCESDGVRFLDFGIDAEFNFCVDGLVLVDMDYLKAKKRTRYIGPIH
ncbi:lysophospholipid acyltransferase family protein [Amphritea sp. 1_MG-2023]|uniref:lysophospholipid acyltransferase family protein n=1 Tax=Amphritea sp. 1_MG-2023 TaxID=3062670 RepID=UPI0026E48AA4|nr:lysophospholipid acyltransferase family protein [Amphritea sp. 1_MG-2023]MDO6562203.1 lysophospholipid acyltransferase family protein [Amphritea sp. 1_MG-2023]